MSQPAENAKKSTLTRKNCFRCARRSKDNDKPRVKLAPQVGLQVRYTFLAVACALFVPLSAECSGLDARSLALGSRTQDMIPAQRCGGTTFAKPPTVPDGRSRRCQAQIQRTIRRFPNLLPRPTSSLLTKDWTRSRLRRLSPRSRPASRTLDDQGAVRKSWSLRRLECHFQNRRHKRPVADCE